MKIHKIHNILIMAMVVMLSITAVAGVVCVSEDSDALTVPTANWSSASTSGTVGQYFTYSWSYGFASSNMVLESGSLPVGLTASLTASTGTITISGTPTATGTYNPWYSFEDTTGDNDYNNWGLKLTITINAVTTYTVAYDSALGTFPSVTVSNGASISLPTSAASYSGYVLDGWRLGSINGTSYSPGSSYTVTGNVTFYAHWSLDEATLEFTNPGTLNAISGSSFSYTPSANVSGTTFSKVSGDSWLSLSGGVITGTAPTVTSKTTYTATFRATSPGGQTANQTITFDVYPVMSLSGSSSVSTITGSAIDSLTVTSNVACTFSATGLPEGLSITEGTISGTPTAAGTYTVSVTATSSVGPSQTVTKIVTVYVSSVLSISSTSDVNIITAGSSYTYAVTVSPSTATLSISGNPSWMVLSEGSVTGTAPGTISEVTEISYTVRATYILGTSTQTVTQDVSFEVEPVLQWTTVPTSAMLIIPVYEYNDDGVPTTFGMSVAELFHTVSADNDNGPTYSTDTFNFVFVGENAESVLWDFGDGTTSDEWTTNHTYAGSGTYTVTCTATNTLGSDVATQTITIDLGDQPSWWDNVVSIIIEYAVYIVACLFVVGFIVWRVVV